MNEPKIELETVGLTFQDFDSAAILMTQKESNVRFYQHLGFKIAHQSVIGQGQGRKSEAPRPKGVTCGITPLSHEPSLQERRGL